MTWSYSFGRDADAIHFRRLLFGKDQHARRTGNNVRTSVAIAVATPIWRRAMAHDPHRTGFAARKED